MGWSAWQDYQGGVMSSADCYNEGSHNWLDHCVQLVGYDTTSSTLADYYIVRNR